LKKGLHIALVLILIISLAAVAGCSSQAPADKPAEQPKVLKVGSEIAYAPFESYDEKNNPVGFDIEILTAIAEDMGYKAEFENCTFDGLIPALQTNKYDCIISAMTITPKRAEQVLFSDPYFKAVQFIAYKKGTGPYEKLADLKGKKVGVQFNTTGQEAVIAAGIDPKKFETAPEAMMDLLNGGIDAAVIDNQVVLLFIQQNPNANLECVTADTPDEFYGIAFNKSNTELVSKVNASLKKLKENGKYAEIYSKYFQGEVPKF